ncbi:MAG: tetratricopeptide repeat protein [Gemmatimonadota bacterium]
MAEKLTLIERLRKAKIVQVLAVYLGASWVVLQIADVLQGTAGLPGWVGAFTLLLLLIGLIIILATAWVQSLASTTAAEEAGEIPTDWEVAPADALASLKSGRLPHLTWGRAILGGVVALSLLFGGAGLYVGLTGRPGVLGPEEAGADIAATGIAVVPFSVSGGEDLDLWREGMVDLMSTNLDGLGGFGTIDSRTVLARWGERVAGGEDPDLRTALEVAAETGARYGLVGALVGNPAGIRVSADLYDLSSGEKVAQVSEEGTADEVLELTSALSVGLTRDLLRETGQGTVQDVRLDALTTASLPALRAYLEGEAFFRDGDFAGAIAPYERAVELDSLFALAWLRLSNAYGWLYDIGNQESARAGERATSLMDRLPARDRLLVQASEAARRGDASFYRGITDAVRRYPDDPDLWFELGEFIYHVAINVGVASLDQAIEAFDRAIELDPGFGPYRAHPLELTIARGDRADAEARLAEYREHTRDQRNVLEAELAIPVLLGDEAEFQQALEDSRTMDVGIVGRVRGAFTNRSDRYDRLWELLWVNRDRAGSDHQWILYGLGAQGALARMDRLTDSLDLAVDRKGLALGWIRGMWSTAVKLPNASRVTPRMCEEPRVSTQCQLFVGWGLARSGDLEGAAESARILREREVEGSAFAGRSADVVEGAMAAARGRTAAARRLLTPGANGTGNEGELARLSLGEVELGEGNVTEAIRHFSGNLYNYTRVAVLRRLAGIYEERGDTAQARTYYRSVLTVTRVGDQDMPELTAAREALARLGG